MDSTRVKTALNRTLLDLSVSSSSSALWLDSASLPRLALCSILSLLPACCFESEHEPVKFCCSATIRKRRLLFAECVRSFRSVFQNELPFGTAACKFTRQRIHMARAKDNSLNFYWRLPLYRSQACKDRLNHGCRMHCNANWVLGSWYWDHMLVTIQILDETLKSRFDVLIRHAASAKEQPGCASS